MAYALITGASKGIGKSIAEQLAKKGIDLLLIARSENVLSEVAEDLTMKYQVNVQYLAVDLSNTQSSDLIKNWCEQNNFKIFILVNNAGYGLWGKFDGLTLKEQQNMLQLNMISLVDLTYHLLPMLRKEPQSYILNVSSTTAYQAVPCFSLYAASKNFVLTFSRGLRYELRKSNVSVSCLSPGTTSTNFMERARMQALEKIAEKFAMPSEDVARTAVKGMFNKKAEIIPGLINKITVGLSYYMPKILFEKIAAGIYEKNLV
jgi:short-subunit dehydrogenase